MLKSPSWTTEFQRAFKKIDELYAFLEWPLPPALIAVAEKYPLFIPYQLALKIKRQGPQGVLAREFLPNGQEVDPVINRQGLMDPIGDKAFNAAPQLIHRYPSRALFTATNICPVHCRYCFRKNELNQADEIFKAEFQQTLSYLSQHPEISEIIFTGGDPLTLSDNRIEFYLKSFAQIPSIKDIRFHTRYPVVLPERIDAGLMQTLTQAAKLFRTVSIAIHANHADEFDENSRRAISDLSQLPLQLLSQTVLLAGINDHPETLLNLFNQFIELKVRPYYLHHPDRVMGGMHFYLPLKTGREIYSQLRQNLPGWALPHYVVDLPGGHGKISAYNPERLEYSGKFMTMTGATLDLPEI